MDGARICRRRHCRLRKAARLPMRSSIGNSSEPLFGTIRASRPRAATRSRRAALGSPTRREEDSRRVGKPPDAWRQLTVGGCTERIRWRRSSRRCRTRASSRADRPGSARCRCTGAANTRRKTKQQRSTNTFGGPAKRSGSAEAAEEPVGSRSRRNLVRLCDILTKCLSCWGSLGSFK